MQRGVLGPWDKPLIALERLTVASLLKEHGCNTACIGKWHLSLNWPTKDGLPASNRTDPMSNVDFTKPIADGPTARGFDHYFGTNAPNYPPFCFVNDDRTVGSAIERIAVKKKRKSSKETTEFSADRPIVSAKSDRLGRKAFAEGLAGRIQGWNGHDSLVIALCGEWGCGKTSLKNMVIENLKRGRSPKVDLLEFNPWEISGRDSMAASFFSELALVLAKGRNE